MSILVFLIPLALLFGLAWLGGLLWALRNGQFDDPDGNAARILLDDEPTPTTNRKGVRQ